MDSNQKNAHASLQRFVRTLTWVNSLAAAGVFFLLLYGAGAQSIWLIPFLLCSLVLQLFSSLYLFTTAHKGTALIAFLLAPVSFFFSIFLPMLAGAAWGRPLRVNNTQIHADLQLGSDWTSGDQPKADNLNLPTRRALEALWLHDAQKEHASVPAFSRISWLLVSAGAGADLISWSHMAALEEIRHTQLCFALAQGYGARSHTVRPLPQMMQGDFDRGQNALLILAKESLSDGCQLEDFNADVAAACALVCQEPTTKAVLELIATQERGHALLSWRVLEWCLSVNPEAIAKLMRASVKTLPSMARPAAVGSNLISLVELADQNALCAHGRLPDSEWQTLWEQRLLFTTQKVQSLLEQEHRQLIAA
jgi:hypothetical protein